MGTITPLYCVFILGVVIMVGSFVFVFEIMVEMMDDDSAE